MHCAASPEPNKQTNNTVYGGGDGGSFERQCFATSCQHRHEGAVFGSFDWCFVEPLVRAGGEKEPAVRQF